MRPSLGGDLSEDLKRLIAKETGDAYRRYSPALPTKTAAVMKTEGDLHHALERNELSLRFQPQVDLQEGRVVTAEAFTTLLAEGRCSILTEKARHGDAMG